MKSLDYERLVPIGYSLGGGVAMGIARDPEFANAFSACLFVSAATWLHPDTFKEDFLKLARETAVKEPEKEVVPPLVVKEPWLEIYYDDDL